MKERDYIIAGDLRLVRALQGPVRMIHGLTEKDREDVRRIVILLDAIEARAMNAMERDDRASVPQDPQ